MWKEEPEWPEDSPSVQVPGPKKPDAPGYGQFPGLWVSGGGRMDITPVIQLVSAAAHRLARLGQGGRREGRKWGRK